MTEIHLIRHAQASFGSADYGCLSDLGHHQAALLGNYWRRVGACFDAVFAGPLRRHVQTAEGALAAAHMVGPLKIVDAFADNDTGHMEIDADPTYLIGMGDREPVLRRPPFGSKAAKAHDMGRE
jgi:broad specificity phosphatase PhoE